MTKTPGLNAVIENLVRKDRGRLLAALIASLNSFDLAEDALSDALESAVIHWQRTGIPDNPQGWLLKVARRKAIDRIRRNNRFKEHRTELARLAAEDEVDANQRNPEIPDERLRLIFTCCHPALDPKTRVALTLRTIGGLSTVEIARAFLDQQTTMGQRLSRARAKISKSGIPFVIPGPEQWQARLESVLAVIYLIFNEGYGASSGDSPVRTGLCEEAIYLARLLDQLKPQEVEIEGLLSLMLTTHARKAARMDGYGVTVSLGQQDRALWDRGLIAQGVAILDDAIARGRSGPYQIKAAISALHAGAQNSDATDWRQIVLLYDSLLGFEPTPVVSLNRAVAIAEAGGLDRALAEFDRLAPQLDGYQPLHAARAEYLKRAGDIAQAAQSYDQAISLAGNAADRSFLQAQKARMLQ